MVHIVAHPIVGRKNIHISASEEFAGMKNGGQGVFLGILGII